MSNNKNEVTEQSTLRQTFYNNNDELDLLDIVAQLWHGKNIIICTVVLFIVLSGIYLFLVKEEWTSESIVTSPSAGQVANYNAALNVLYAQYPQDKLAISDLQKQLFGRFSASISALSGSLQNLEIPLELKVAPVVVGKDEPLSITFSAETAEKSQQELSKYIKAVNDDVVDDYGADIKRSLAVKQRELTESLASQVQVAKEKKNQRIEVIKQSLKIAVASNITKSQLRQAEYLSDDTLYMLGTDSLNAMIANESTKPLAFDEIYYGTQRALLSIQKLKIQVENLQSYRFIMQPDLPVRRDSPKRLLTILMAIIAGAFFGSIVVITRNMISNYRQRIQ